ncbi:MAG TPA: small acid-soluble spore protein H [Chondromyces sp.]|nr:small acid-soluble spore protein H [Chondromyces sp.]
MDAQRAQEISSSPSMIDVICNGQKVYIEHVDRQKGLATIHPLDEPTNKQSVPVTSLTEH